MNVNKSSNELSWSIQHGIREGRDRDNLKRAVSDNAFAEEKRRDGVVPNGSMDRSKHRPR